MDGRHIITASEDRTARIWDAKTGIPVCLPLKHFGWVIGANFSHDGTRALTCSEDGTARTWDTMTGQQIGPPLKHGAEVRSAVFSPSGYQVLTASEDRTARVWDAKPERHIGTALADSITAFCVGVRLNHRLGSVEVIASADRHSIWQKLKATLADFPDWRFAVEQTFPQDPQAALVSPHLVITVREATTRLIGTLNPANIQEAAELDPGHPLLPFAHALREAVKTDTQPANPIRAAWLIDYGMKRLPADTTAPDLRLAAQLIAAVAKTLPEQKPTALTLLERAAKLAPEDDETKALRESLK